MNLNQEKQRIVEGVEKIFAPLYDPAHDHVNVRIVAEELSRFLTQSLDTLHAAVVREVGKEIWEIIDNGMKDWDIMDIFDRSRAENKIMGKIGVYAFKLQAPNKDKEE